MRLGVKVGLFVLMTSSLISIQAAPVASAATSYFSSSTYYAYETFSSSGTWTKPYGVTAVDYLVVAGGGRGGGSQASGHFAGGGGGGGGVRSGSLSIAQSSYTITVGTGQAVGCSQGRGGNSSIAGADITTISATGGGSGSCNANGGDGGGGINGYSGGSGGGAGAQTYGMTFGTGNAGGYSPVEGYSGGSAVSDAYNGSNQSGGGGGGAGQVGSNGTTGCGGKGGNGVVSSITGSSLTYGGGGGGGTRSSACGGTAGTGGGGTGGVNGGQGSAGADGLGGGGGGTSLSNGNRGGNGIVIVRFLLTAPETPTLPAISDTGQSNSDDITSTTTFNLTGFAVGGSTIQIYDGATAVGSPCTANVSTGAYSCAVSGVSPGSHSFTARASFNGGAAITSGALTVVVDTAAPSLSPAAAITIAENQTSITTISCNETCTLAMTAGADSASVTFTANTGVLVLKTAADFEAPTDVGNNRTYAVTIQGTDLAGNAASVNYVVTISNLNEDSVLGAPAVNGVAYKGVSINLVVTSNAAGRVRFFMDGKRIANCLSVSTSGSYPNFTATCNWKPAATARRQLTASIAPTDSSFSSTTSPVSNIFILKRTTAR